MPAFSARRPAAWIEGPSAIGSVKGMPISMMSAPAFGSALMMSSDVCGIGIAGHHKGDERRAALFGEFGKACVDTGGHFFLPFRISVICGMSLSPRPERLTTIR